MILDYMIELTGLVKKYNKIHALQGITLNINSHKIFGLVGPNGAGKSTIINIIAGLINKTAGQIKLIGLEINSNNYVYKQRLGFVLEKYILIEKLTGKEYLFFASRMYNVEETNINNRINELLEVFELSDKGNTLIEDYSLGMKKKLAFAAAIIHNPKILFLDEPFENVDPISRKKMKDILKRMKEKGATVFITSHALAEVEDFCDEVAIINKGKIVYQSETKDIRNKIKNEVTKETYQSLEEIFIDLTTDKDENDKTLSWI